MMHAGSIKTSRPLQAALSYLRSKGRVGATTLELSRALGEVAFHSTAAALRANGYDILCRYDGRSSTGRKVYRYWYKGRI